MKLDTHLKVARKLKAARACLASARVDLINELGSRRRPDPRERNGPASLTIIEELEDALSVLDTWSLERRLLKEHPHQPLLRHVWRGQDIGVVTWARGLNGQMVAIDKIAPADSNTPILFISAQVEAEAEVEFEEPQPHPPRWVNIKEKTWNMK